MRIDKLSKLVLSTGTLLLGITSLPAQTLEMTPESFYHVLPAQGESVISMNGDWKFKYFSSPDKVGSDSLFYQPSFNVNGWGELIVPGCWETLGVDKPIYGKKARNCAGLYRRDIVVPTSWKGQPVFLAFDGVSFGYQCWVNGQYVGEFASSFNRHTFDISGFVKPGENNTVAVKVVTHPKGWEFDTNDDWVLSGIIRDVTMFKHSSAYISDLFVHTASLASDKATLQVETTVIDKVSDAAKRNLTLTGKLLDSENRMVQTFTTPVQTIGKMCKVDMPINKPHLWSAENPYLYTLELTLADGGKLLQKYEQVVGIRQVEWKEGVLKLNGSPIKLRGTNHHDQSPLYGRTITEAEMMEDLMLMKQANVNFIRMAHYPPHSRFLELCDSLGFYVMDEVSYGHGDQHLTDTTYLPILKMRALATVASDKNHPSIIIWSAGNENPVTPIGLETGRYLKTLDATRPYLFPQTPTHFWEMMKDLPEDVDMLDWHYPKANTLEEGVPQFKKPLIASEYAHALGLDMNDVEDIYDVMYRYPNLAGGAVWGFFDQGLLRKADKPVKKGETTIYAWETADTFYDTGGNQGTDGIVYANRVPQTDYWEIRKVFAPVKALDTKLAYQGGKQTLTIPVSNRHDFTNLMDIDCGWKLYADNQVMDYGKLAIDCLPHDTTDVDITVTLPEQPEAAFYYVELTFKDKEGYQFYEKVYRLEPSVKVNLASQICGTDKVKSNWTKKGLSNKNYQLSLTDDKANVSMSNANGKQLILNASYARVGRKATMAQTATQTTRREETRNKHKLMSDYILAPAEGKVVKSNKNELTVDYIYKTDSVTEKVEGRITYRFQTNGSIDVTYELRPDTKRDALEAGLSFVIPSTLSEFRWIGKGPYEAYPGKEMISEFGFHHLNNEDLYFAGNRQETDCAVFADKEGNGFVLVADKADIAVERREGNLVVSHNVHVSERFNKYEWPVELLPLRKGTTVSGSFTIIPLNGQWPSRLIEWFGYPQEVALPYIPFYHSYDQ